MCRIELQDSSNLIVMSGEERALAAFGNPKSPRCEPEVLPEPLATLSMLTQPLQLREFLGEPSALPYRSSKAEPGTEPDPLKLSTKKGAASVPCPTIESRYDFGRAPPSTAWEITSSVPSAIAGSFSIGETFSSSICIADSVGSCSGSQVVVLNRPLGRDRFRAQAFFRHSIKSFDSMIDVMCVVYGVKVCELFDLFHCLTVSFVSIPSICLRL
nr:hypothetical protein Iba_chr06eCG8720 [Ipomoea batatas]